MIGGRNLGGLVRLPRFTGDDENEKDPNDAHRVIARHISAEAISEGFSACTEDNSF